MGSTLCFTPQTVAEALRLLDEHGHEAIILAGGTDVVVDMTMKRQRPDVIVYIGNLPLEGVNERDGCLHIGPTTRMATLAHSLLVRDKAPVLAQAASVMGSPLIRNLATVGGNLATASPAADTASALLGLGAEIRLSCLAGERTIPLTDFFTGPKTSACEAAELMTDISVPLPAGKRGSWFLKMGRRKALSLSIANVTVVLDWEDDAVRDAKIALGAVAPTPMRAARAEAVLAGRPLTEDIIKEAAEVALEEIKPIDDGRSTAWYRRETTGVLIVRALRKAVESMTSDCGSNDEDTSEGSWE